VTLLTVTGDVGPGAHRSDQTNGEGESEPSDNRNLLNVTELEASNCALNTKS